MRNFLELWLDEPPRMYLLRLYEKLRIRVEPVAHQVHKTAPQSSISVFLATEEYHQGFSNYCSYGLSTLDFIQLAAQQTASVRRSTEASGILSSRCAQATRKKLPPGHLLPQEHVGVLAGGALPGTLRIAEVDSNRTRAGETTGRKRFPTRTIL